MITLSVQYTTSTTLKTLTSIFTKEIKEEKRIERMDFCNFYIDQWMEVAIEQEKRVQVSSWKRCQFAVKGLRGEECSDVKRRDMWCKEGKKCDVMLRWEKCDKVMLKRKECGMWCNEGKSHVKRGMSWKKERTT